MSSNKEQESNKTFEEKHPNYRPKKLTKSQKKREEYMKKVIEKKKVGINV